MVGGGVGGGVFFFLQEEDGIRGLVRSRGLEDVYKRQVYEQITAMTWHAPVQLFDFVDNMADIMLASDFVTVSYTHLTLPTSDLV